MTIVIKLFNFDGTHFHRAEGAADAEERRENFSNNMSGNKSIAFAVL